MILHLYMWKILLRTEYPEEHAFSLRFTGVGTNSVSILDASNALSFHAVQYKYAVMPVPVPNVTEKVLLQTISPDKNQTTGKTSLVVIGNPHFQPVFLNTVFWPNNVFSYFCPLPMTL